MQQWSKIVSDAVPKLRSEVSAGHALSLLLVLIAGAVAWGTSQADFRALAQRVEQGEKRDEKAAETLDQMKSNVIELKGDMKATKTDVERQGRQLDRIEMLLRNLPQAQPTTPPRSP